MLVSPTSTPSTTTVWLPALTAYSTPTLPPAALPRHLRDARQPLAFFSRKLSSAESRYSTFNMVLLAFHYAVRHFRHLIEGTSFSLQTDHLPLVHAFNKKPGPCSARQLCHLSATSEFNHPRPWHSISINDMTISTMSAILALGFLFSSVDTSSNHFFDRTACHRSLQRHRTTLLWDVSTGRPHPWVSLQLRRHVFNHIFRPN